MEFNQLDNPRMSMDSPWIPIENQLKWLSMDPFFLVLARGGLCHVVSPKHPSAKGVQKKSSGLKKGLYGKYGNKAFLYFLPFPLNILKTRFSKMEIALFCPTRHQSDPILKDQKPQNPDFHNLLNNWKCHRTWGALLSDRVIQETPQTAFGKYHVQIFKNLKYFHKF